MNIIPSYISLSFPPLGTYNRLVVIKAVRVLTGLGLKEAKDFTEQTGPHIVRVVCSDGVNWSTGVSVPAHAMYQNAIAELKANSVVVIENSVRSDILMDLRKIVTQAVTNNELELAFDLLTILKKYS